MMSIENKNGFKTLSKAQKIQLVISVFIILITTILTYINAPDYFILFEEMGVDAKQLSAPQYLLLLALTSIAVVPALLYIGVYFWCRKKKKLGTLLLCLSIISAILLFAYVAIATYEQPLCSADNLCLYRSIPTPLLITNPFNV